MRRSFTVVFFFLLMLMPLSATEAPDCIVKFEVSGPVCVDRAQVSGIKQARHFGTYTKAPKSARKTTVAGKVFTPSPSVSSYSSAAPWLAEAQRYAASGGNPTGKRNLWCVDFVNLTLKNAGRPGTGTRMAREVPHYGRRLSSPVPGAIAVYPRGKDPRKGHAAIVEKVEGNTVTLISGNCGPQGVCRYTRSIGAAIAYVWPS